MILLVSLLAVPHSVAATAVVPSITTSAIPIAYAGENVTYVARANMPVSSWAITGTSLQLSYTSGSSQVVVWGSTGLLNGTQNVTLTATTANGIATQNWEMTTLNSPFVWSIPAFTVNTGQVYDYAISSNTCLPSTSVLCLSLSPVNYTGEPTLSYSNRTIQGSITAGNFTNNLTVRDTVRVGEFSQFWETSTVISPTQVSFPCANTNVTWSLTDGYPAGCSVDSALHMVFSGEYVQASNFSGTLSEVNGTYSATNATLFIYGQPYTNVTTSINGNLTTVSEPSSGFAMVIVNSSGVHVPTGGGGIGSSHNPYYVVVEWILLAIALAVIVSVTILFLARHARRGRRKRSR